MQRTKRLRPAVAMLAVLGLGACDTLKDELGMSKQSPDEFRVVARAPLSLPPDYNLLVTPNPGQPRPQEGTTTDQARTAVFGTQPQGQPVTSGSSGETALLTAAGAQNANPEIRQVVDQETQQINTESEYFLDELIFWRDDPEPGVLVDPAKESQRIKENQALGRPITEGETPTIERHEQGIFEGIF
jgi:hypothetical protein